MSSELATDPRARDPRPIDVLREAELRRRTDAGQDALDAWAVIATDERIGLDRWRGKTSVPVPAAVRTYARFLSRIAPSSVETARHRMELETARMSERNGRTIQDIADGKFDDPEVARTRLMAARERLKCVGIGADKQTRISTTVPIQLNNFLAAPLPRE